ncbi:hypothetical protein NKF06_13155 [Haloferax sp. AB510]|uniref:hypothetical protein n=1 Tax=Haloferax sp. AB510 TaxID=2934172 RepID=UPI00209BE641|nr:hypothetical protein [Haloferax sp. AB510]MCO8267509.1 hypothetical protein [Haloferax sp. AB510]
MKRRALLTTLSGSILSGVTGCLGSDSERSASQRTTTEPPTKPPTTASPTPDQTRTQTPVSRVNLGVKNESDRGHTLSVQVTQADETVLDQSVDIGPGPGHSMSIKPDIVGEGVYSVVAGLDTGTRLHYEWSFEEEDRGLEIIITSDGALEPRENESIELNDESLPYTVSGAKDIFIPPRVVVRNESNDASELTVTLEHSGDQFFVHTFDALRHHEISAGPVVKSHATYDVFVETADGKQSTYEWKLGEYANYPVLAVLITESGALRVGCAWPGTAVIVVENNDDTQHEVTATLTKDDVVVTETTQTVAPRTDHLTVGFPIGDEYELTVATPAGSTTVPYLACNSASTKAEVQLHEGVPTVETGILSWT